MMTGWDHFSLLIWVVLEKRVKVGLSSFTSELPYIHVWGVPLGPSGR